MYEMIKKGDGTINVLKNNKELFNRIMHEDNVAIYFIPQKENPSMIMVTEDLDKMQTATFYDTNGKYITGIGFNNNLFLASLKDKPVHIIEQDSEEYKALINEHEETGFFSLILENSAFAVYLKNDYTNLIEKETEIYNFNKPKKHLDNLFVYSYFGEVVSKTKVESEDEVADYLDEILDYDSELIN